MNLELISWTPIDEYGPGEPVCEITYDRRPYEPVWHDLEVVEEDGELCGMLHHTDRCQFYETIYDDYSTFSWECLEGRREQDVGFDFDPTWGYGLDITEPGLYRVISWFEKIEGFDYTEFDEGWELERDDDGSPARRESDSGTE